MKKNRNNLKIDALQYSMGMDIIFTMQLSYHYQTLKVNMEWIMVTERLPEINGGEVLVTDGKKCWVASRWQFEASKFNPDPEIFFSPTICDCCDDEEFRNPSHWMSLPKPPEECKYGV